MSESVIPRACVIGHPIAHSRSPLIHGYWLKKYGIAGSYVKRPVRPEEAAAFFRGMREEGITVMLVEQSLNVALSVSDRAVFLEKGQVRFEGPAAELAERDDLARAVFLGREGG